MITSLGWGVIFFRISFEASLYSSSMYWSVDATCSPFWSVMSTMALFAPAIMAASRWSMHDLILSFWFFILKA